MPTLASSVTPVDKFRKKTSVDRPFPSAPPVSSGALDVKMSVLPSPDSTGAMAGADTWRPALLRLARMLVPRTTSRTTTSGTPLRSFGTRSAAREVKATKRPSSEMLGCELAPTATSPPAVTLTSRVAPVERSRRKTSVAALLSGVPSPRRSVAADVNATKRPSAETTASKLAPLPGKPCGVTLTSSVVPVVRSRAKMSAAATAPETPNSAALAENTTTRPPTASACCVSVAPAPLRLPLGGRLAMTISPFAGSPTGCGTPGVGVVPPTCTVTAGGVLPGNGTKPESGGRTTLTGGGVTLGGSERSAPQPSVRR